MWPTEPHTPEAEGAREIFGVEPEAFRRVNKLSCAPKRRVARASVAA